MTNFKGKQQKKSLKGNNKKENKNFFHRPKSIDKIEINENEKEVSERIFIVKK